MEFASTPFGQGAKNTGITQKWAPCKAPKKGGLIIGGAGYLLGGASPKALVFCYNSLRQRFGAVPIR